MPKKNDWQDKRADAASAAHKKKLDRLFDSGGQTPDRFKDAKEQLKGASTPEEIEWRDAVIALRDTEGFREFATAATKFQRAGHKLPDDVDLLVRLLDHPSERLVCAALEQFISISERRDLTRGTAILNRLKTIRSIAESPQTLKLADDIEEIL